MQKELKFHLPNNKTVTVVELDNEYYLKKNQNIKVMINNNRNKRFISDEKAEDVKDRLLGTTNNPLFHIVYYDKVNRKYIGGKKALRKIEITTV